MSCFSQSIRSKRDKCLFEFPRDKFPFTLLCRPRDALPWIVSLLLIRIKEKWKCKAKAEIFPRTETEKLQKKTKTFQFSTQIQYKHAGALPRDQLTYALASRTRNAWACGARRMYVWSMIMNDNDVSECEWEFAQNTCTRTHIFPTSSH